jgi:Tol biopolymer transport system component
MNHGGTETLCLKSGILPQKKPSVPPCLRGELFFSGMAALLVLAAASGRAGEATGPDYSKDIEPILRRYCTGCHNKNEASGRLVLESREGIARGGRRGPAIVPRSGGESRLIQVLTGDASPSMPPRGRPRPSDAEIDLLKRWIDSGAPGPTETKREAGFPAVPRIAPRVSPRDPIQSASQDPRGRFIALARYGRVELVSPLRGDLLLTYDWTAGAVNSVAFSQDGSRVVAAGGEPQLFGEAVVYAPDGTIIRTFRGHRDCLYAGVLSPDGRTLATGGYEGEIRLWDMESEAAKEPRVLAGHNAAVFDLAFRPDGKVLASASGDRTVKLWSVATGERLETFSQPLKEQYTVAFSPDGKQVAAGGGDNRIRVWAVSESGKEGTNPILRSRFAHQGAILKLVYSPDGSKILSSAEDRTVKLFDARSVTEERELDAQPDWTTALSFSSEGRTIFAGRQDGSFAFYDATTGKETWLAGKLIDPDRERDRVRVRERERERDDFGFLVSSRQPPAAGRPPAGGEAPAQGKPSQPPAKPELSRADPRGLQRGVTTRIKLIGKNLAGASEVKFSSPKLKGRLVLAEGKPEEARIEVTADRDTPRGPLEASIVTPAGESGRVAIEVDDLPQVIESEPDDDPARATAGKLPTDFWGVIASPGDADHFAFDAKAGATVVLDLEAQRLGSKARLVLTVLDPDGKVIASATEFPPDLDPLIALPIARSGRYTARVNDLLLGGSEGHHYRLTAGALPFVTAFHPLSVAAGKESEVELAGFNLPADARLRVAPAREGEFDLPLDPERFRGRGPFKAIASAGPELVEAEPNDEPARANPIPAPGVVCGRIDRRSGDPGADVDMYRFAARAGEKWVIETEAASRRSPIDTALAVLHPDGRPVERVRLQAVRDSTVTFRGIDSSSTECRVRNWEEMELNQLLYLDGEVVKLFRAPQGPDSAFIFYTSQGRRRTYFDTTATAHPLESPCYIVEPIAPGAAIVPSGLPVFTLSFQNDDDGERRLGRDSRIDFTPPADGDYLIAVRDAGGRGGDRHAYRLKVRPARPDFQVTLDGASPEVSAGSGKGFSVRVDRIDGFEGPVAIEIAGLPSGFSVSYPLAIEAGQSEAKGTIFAAADAPPPPAGSGARIKVTATALVDGKPVAREVNSLGDIRLGAKPKLLVRLEPAGGGGGPIVVSPGASVPAVLKVERNGHQDLVTFNVDNLPHGVIVDDIGLNGVLIPAGQSERQIFIACARWVGETSRPCHAVESQAGGQTSPPVLLEVRRPAAR